MKLAFRILALSAVVAGITAAATTPNAVPAFVSHQSASAILPTPGTNSAESLPLCGPHMACYPVVTSGN